MLLNQIRASGESTSEAIRQLALAEFMASLPIANFAQFYEMRGNADTPRKTDTNMTAGANRSISTGYTAKDNTPVFANIALKIYGDLVETDIAYERRGIDIGSQRERDLVNFAKSMGRYFMNSVINDASSASKFSGLKEQATALTLKTIFDTINGGLLPTGNGNTERKQQDKFIELLTAKVSAVRPSILLANSLLIARLASIGRGYLSTSNVKDIYGSEHTVNTFFNVPIIDAGYTADASGLIIPLDEDEGTSTAQCTSLYLIRFGEETDVTFATNKGMDVKDLGLVGTKYQTLMELDVDLAVLDNTSLSRISGIIL